MHKGHPCRSAKSPRLWSHAQWHNLPNGTRPPYIHHTITTRADADPSMVGMTSPIKDGDASASAKHRPADTKNRTLSIGSIRTDPHIGATSTGNGDQVNGNQTHTQTHSNSHNTVVNLSLISLNIDSADLLYPLGLSVLLQTLGVPVPRGQGSLSYEPFVVVAAGLASIKLLLRGPLTSRVCSDTFMEAAKSLNHSCRAVIVRARHEIRASTFTPSMSH
ncbi:uncharacterized protein FPRO_10503 [Fusarium proliferatum ET1]|uniref:Uncharacterized protein n=1 Tax=Fusarium proliferatum (strain ET1) TaxID=1227346 RepID=A0A1L7VKF7_FUSPR|nr:uncharacterized protein FPRO_10503 [Fusarium proliferatum ET1]CZR40914.1 uncharacterized protein FPRO_10503 [Fusarium proliferatum ET1]